MRFLRLVMRSLVLLLVALFSAVTAMRLAIHGREVRVPNLLGMTSSEAREKANVSGLTVSVEDKFYSSEVPTGKIISQMPPPYSKVRRGWRLRVAESLGPQRVAVPDLLGQSRRAATINLSRRGLDVATIASVPLPGAVPDEVVAQIPPPNASGIASPKISILLAAKPPAPEYVMPNFVGRSLAEAKEKIAKAGLQIASVIARNPVSGPQIIATPSGTSTVATSAITPVVSAVPTASGKVVAQDPPTGARVSPDTAIHLEVSQ